MSYLEIFFLICCGFLQLTDSSPKNLRMYGSCDKGMTCVPLQECLLSQKEYETSYPCDDGGAMVCCPKEPGGGLINKDGAINPSSSTTTKATITSKSSSTKVTTPKPITTTPYVPFTLDNVWEKVPSDLREKLKLLPEDCGTLLIVDRILNGMDAGLGEFPWMALLGFEDPETKQQHFICGGTLINNRYILTAAHCSKAGNFTPSFVRLGEWNLETEKDCVELSDGKEDCANPVEDVPIESFTKHDMYGRRDLPLFRFDVALVRMAKEVEFTDFIKPICLTSKVHRNRKESYTVSGWGVTDNDLRTPSPILQTVRVKLFDFNECNAAAPAEVSPLAGNLQFCAGGSDGQDACRGDSGGPLSFSLHNREYQKGVVSLATSSECGREGKPTVYTEITSFIKWILKNIQP